MMTASVLKSEPTLITDRVRSHALGAYLGVAIGDALGATVEFMTAREVSAKHGVHKDIIGGGWLNLKPGQVTDDTEMSFALGQALLRAGGVQATVIAEHFSDWMASKPKDIGHTVRRGIVDFRRTGTPRQKLNPQAAGNGACMRIVPLVLATIGAPWRTVRQGLHIQNHITHHAVLSDAGTETVAHMTMASILGQVDKPGLMKIAETLSVEHADFQFEGKEESNPSGFIVHTLKAVFQSLDKTDSFEDCLIDVVNRGGDADTTGAIAGMIAGAFYGQDGIPKRWLKRLDPAIYEVILEQSRALLEQADCKYGA